MCRSVPADLISRNPEDCLPIATSSQSSHSRQFSQPESPKSSPKLQAEAAIGRLNQPDSIPPLGEALDRPDLTSMDMLQSSPSPASMSSSPHPPQSFSRPFHPTSGPPPPPAAAAASSSSSATPQRPRVSTRKMSKGGGVQMVLEEAGSWSELADHSAVVGEGSDAAKGGKAGNSGMLAFLSRKKGRDRSPKPTEPGVLGKEGARQIIN